MASDPEGVQREKKKLPEVTFPMIPKKKVGEIKIGGISLVVHG